MNLKRRAVNLTARPWVIVNMAMSADGKIATANRKVSSFGSKRDFEHLLALRATADAIMCGARTIDLEPVNLGPGPARFRRKRLASGLSEYPLRVIVSGRCTVHPEAEIFDHRFSPIIVLTTKQAARRRIKRMQSLGAEVATMGDQQLDWQAALACLRHKHKVKRLLCEGGGELNAALFAAGVVDEMHLTICPFVVGGRTAPTIADGIGVEKLAEACRLQLKSTRQVGDEVFARFQRQSLSRCV